MKTLAGIDIGGTKCAVVVGQVNSESGLESIKIIDRSQFPTLAGAGDTIARLMGILKGFQHKKDCRFSAIGISCGGPLDSEKGLILSPPNLPGWDKIDILTPFHEEFKVPVTLENDANAGALAEWKFGAGRGCQNLVFLTFGTGMGAGLILNGRLYRGSNGLAGEVGHIRLSEKGPVGYGKGGSFEGFCSGGGIARLARQMAEEALIHGKAPLFCLTQDALSDITAEQVAQAARQGDKIALRVFEITAERLGQGLAVLVDILNPEKIVIGSIYHRQRELLEEITLKNLQQEALYESLQDCEIVPASLKENTGDLAALSVALYQLEYQKGSPNLAN